MKFTTDVEINGELAAIDTSIKRDNRKVSVLVYRKAVHTDQCLHHSAHHQTSCKESIFFLLVYYKIVYNHQER